MTWKGRQKGSKMIEMSVVVFILMIVLFLALVVAAFAVGVFAGLYMEMNTRTRESDSTDIIKFEN